MSGSPKHVQLLFRNPHLWLEMVLKGRESAFRKQQAHVHACKIEGKTEIALKHATAASM